MATLPDTTTLDPLMCSPDGEPRGVLARVGDLFPLDPAISVRAASGEPASAPGTRPWGLRFARIPRARTVDDAAVVVYDPVLQLSVDATTGLPVFKRRGGTKETTGIPDGSNPSPEETTKD